MRTVVTIPDDLWERAKNKAIVERASLAEIVRRALKEYLGKKKTSGRKKR